MDEYPSNSINQKRAPEKALPTDPPKLEQVTTGKVIIQKPSLGRRFKDAFVGEDGKNVGRQVLREVMIPAGKDMLFDAGQEMLGRVLGIETRGRRTGGGLINYSSISSSLASKVNYNRPGFMQDPRQAPQGMPNGTNTTRGRVHIQDIILSSRVEADEVIKRLDLLIYQFGQAKVADLFDLVGKTGEWTDEKFGWYSMEGARPQHTSVGYLLDLPRPVQLD